MQDGQGVYEAANASDNYMTSGYSYSVLSGAPMQFTATGFFLNKGLADQTWGTYWTGQTQSNNNANAHFMDITTGNELHESNTWAKIRGSAVRCVAK